MLIVSASDGPAVSRRARRPGERGRRTTHAELAERRAEATYEFDGAPVLGVLADGAADVLHQHASPALLLQGDGLLAGARDLTAGYVKERTQFGRRLAEFQGVAIQMADVYVASRMVSLAAEEAARRVAASEPAADDLAVGCVLVLRPGAGRAADLSPPARRHGRRRDLPAAPLLRPGQGRRAACSAGPRPRSRRCRRSRPDAANVELTTSSARSRTRCAATSPGWSHPRTGSR